MRKDAPGYSLVETAAVAAVVAITCGLALPSLQEALRRQRLATAMHLVTAQLAQARSTAITRRMPVTLCPSRGDGRCAAGTDWSGDWLLFLDPARTGQPASEANVLRNIRQPFHPDVRVVSSTGRHRVRYQPDGRNSGTNLTLRVCVGGQLRGEVVVNNAGRTRSQRLERPQPCPES
ncbi:GspH/FimT family pseudopilin [Pseudoxanthomonas suwonensis]|uniref:GspH/FimT family pseudopilin n=1 Tax=Pseudoxanthomonas suwonensis TaxID=314722 RepID=UPI00048F31DC|nr:GspH/FimT family pseudopilin [Pseudoxanthomonas suwonensis]